MAAIKPPRKKAVRRPKHKLIVDKITELSYGDLAKIPGALVDADKNTAYFIMTALQTCLAEAEDEAEGE